MDQQIGSAADGAGSSEPTARPGCELCGAESLVRVLEGYTRAVPRFRHYCIRCAESTAAQLPSRQMSKDVSDDVRQPISLGTLLMTIGLTLGVVAELVEHLAIPFSSGFGWSQRVVVVGGAILTLLGALLRVDLLVIGGAILVALAAAVDLIADVSETSSGIQTVALVGIGVALIGVFLRRRALKKRAASNSEADG